MVETALWRGDKLRAKAAIDAIFEETGRFDKPEETSPIAVLDLPSRVEVVLERERIFTVGALRACKRDEILNWWMSGPHVLEKILEGLSKRGLQLTEDEKKTVAEKPEGESHEEAENDLS